MSPPELPDDPAEWPTDARALFGMKPNGTRHELRRAYTRLIRRFKPEHSPAQFRRIRDAYEELEQQLRWQEEMRVRFEADELGDDEVDQQPDTGAMELRPSSPQIVPDNAPHGVDDPAESDRLHRSTPGPLPGAAADRAWREAVRSGELSVAYRELAAASQRHEPDEELYCRLFWLLTLDPSVDPARRPIDWIIAGLERTQLGGRLLELYRQELEQQPELVEINLAGTLSRPAEIWRVATLARSRTSAAARTKLWTVLRADLSALRTVLLYERESWILLLLFAVDRLAWSQDLDALALLSDCQCEIDGASDLHLSLADQFDRYEHLISLSESSNRRNPDEGQSPPSFVRQTLDLESGGDLVAETWMHSAYPLRSQLLATAAAWLSSPYTALKGLDQIASCNRPVVVHLASSFELLVRLPQATAAEQAQACETISRFLQAFNWQNYADHRGELLAFLLREFLSVDDILQLSAEDSQLPDFEQNHLVATLTADAPLRCLTAANRACWSL